MNNVPGHDYVVTIARHGTRATARGEVFLNYPLYRQPDGPMGMDYFVWLLQSADRTIVVDTGFSRHGAEVRGREVLFEVPDLLRRLGVDAAHVKTVIITHAHYDHIGNLEAFPEARFVLSRREYEFWTGPHAHQTLFRHSVERDELAMLQRLVDAGRVDFFDRSVRPAPGVEVIEVGGHTPGQSVVRVNTTDGAVLLASDAVHYYEELMDDMPFSAVADLVEMYDAFAWMRHMLASGEISHVVAGHDPTTLSRFAPVSGELRGDAATIGAAVPTPGARS